MQKVDNVAQNRQNLKRGRDLQSKRKTTLSKQNALKSNFIAVLDDTMQNIKKEGAK